MSENYSKDWSHCTIHLNKDTCEMHSDGDHSVRVWIQDRIAQLEAEVANLGSHNKHLGDQNVGLFALLEQRDSQLQAANTKLEQKDKTIEKAIAWHQRFIRHLDRGLVDREMEGHKQQITILREGLTR